jgi:hypothetical protein
MAAPAQAVEPLLRLHVSTKMSWVDPLLPVQGPTVVSYAGNGTSSAQVRWGPAEGSQPSGYDAWGAEDDTIDYFGGVSPFFIIGQFRHINGDAEPSGISGITLNMVTRIVGPTGLDLELFLPLPFSHDETGNALTPCPYGGANGQGINSAGCADRAISAEQGLLQIQNFSFDGRQYRILFYNIPPIGETFLTAEGSESAITPILMFQIDSRAGAVVPEPGSWAMLIAGFGLVGAMARRRRSRTGTARAEWRAGRCAASGMLRSWRAPLTHCGQAREPSR